MSKASTTRRLLACVLVVGALAGCVREPATSPPTAVPADAVPRALDGDLELHDFSAARDRFAALGPASLVDDAALYEVRRDERLVGSLQVTALDGAVQTSGPGRKALLAQLLNGQPYDTRQIDGVTVAAVATARRALYVWFGPRLLMVLQMKTDESDPALAVGSVIRHQRAKGLLVEERADDGVTWGWEGQAP